MTGNPLAPEETLSDEALWSMVEQVWESLLGAPAERLADDAACTDGDLLAAQIQLTGAFSGAVSVCAPRTAVEQMAVRMLDLEPGNDVDPVDVEDAFGEVVNVLGGSVKALLPGPSQLGLPSVLPGPADATGTTVRRVVTRWDGGGVEVAVHHHH
ncbi:chemotaxis protein CheX [Thalassiella azotivora]